MWLFVATNVISIQTFAWIMVGITLLILLVSSFTLALKQEVEE